LEKVTKVTKMTRMWRPRRRKFGVEQSSSREDGKTARNPITHHPSPIDLNQTKLMTLLIPTATLEIMPDTGHVALFEHPDEFSQIVKDYLGS
jgi:pimeloyl-ACP methyl ester carboxylesterase